MHAIAPEIPIVEATSSFDIVRRNRVPRVCLKSWGRQCGTFAALTAHRQHDVSRSSHAADLLPRKKPTPNHRVSVAAAVGFLTSTKHADKGGLVMRRPEQGSTTLTALAISVGLLLPPNVIRAQGITRPEGRHPESPSFIGTGGTRLYRVGPMEFQPDDSAATAFNTLFSPGFGRYTTQGGNLYAMPHLPSGALVTGVELDYCDTNPGDFHPQLQVSSASYNGTGLTPLGIVSGTGINGCGLAFLDLTNKNFAVDNNQNELILQAQLGASDGSEAIAGAIVHYKLQVSPAPATATFADVPTSYIYFRAIEALAASGVTSGCGGGNYCPNQSVTRGEMAKFLAVALGLAFE